MAQSGLRAYFELVYHQHDCYATWPPGSPVVVGDIGRLSENGSFLRSGSLATRAPGEPLPGLYETSPANETLASSAGVTFSAGAVIETNQVVAALAGLGAKLDLTLSRADSAAMVLKEITERSFSDERPIRDLMSALRTTDEIDEDEIIVTWVREARIGVIATTCDSDAGGDMGIDAKAGPATITIANVAGHLTVASHHDAQTVAEAAEGRPLTPMYRALVFKRNHHWWSFWRSWLEIGSGIRTRDASEGGDDLVASSRPSLVALDEPDTDV
jgi:hypothetical protein